MRKIIKMENRDEFFITRDFYLAAFLRAKGIKLIRAVKQNNTTSFYFEKLDKIEKLTQNLYNDTEMVSATRFINAIRDLRAYSYNIKNTI